MLLRAVLRFVEKIPRLQWRLLVVSALVVVLIVALGGLCEWSMKQKCVSLMAELIRSLL